MSVVSPDSYLERFSRGVTVSAARPSGSPFAATGPTYSTAQGAEEIAAMLRGDAFGSPEGAMCVAAFYRCVSLIAGAVATMPASVKRRVDERTRVDASDHQLWTLLRRRPNRWQTPSQFKRQLQTQALMRGNGYAMKVMAGRRVSALIPLHPDRMRVEQLADFSLQYDYTRKDGTRIKLPQSEVMHLLGMTLDGVNGLSVMSCARATIGHAVALQKHGTATFANSTRLGGTLKHPGKLGPEAVKTLRESLEIYRGPENAGKNLILEEGMTFERMAMTLEDAQFIESAGLTRQEIYMFFGVPPHMAGDTSKSTSWGTGIEQQSLGFVAYTLQDWLTTWEETIARDLIDERETDLFVRFNTAGLVRGDIKTRYGAYSVARQWGLQTINEIRALEDMNPIDGGDELFAGGNGQRTTETDEEPADDRTRPDPDDRT